jgi:ferredoxin
MAVMITAECTNCDACAPECPVAAILDDASEKSPFEGQERFYVKPETCVECVDHADTPRCAEACPTDGAIVWDMPYTTDYTDYFLSGHESGTYKIREHKKKGMMLPTVKELAFLSEVSMDARTAHSNVAGSL